ncbi:PIG-L deacetylase family protein [Ilumatobacter sp.]|uniref:PIG-L deacetylase family protein n=1 Tax=Ilumatobacter sp. TaxID=1967498 RepID=UPI003AF68489
MTANEPGQPASGPSTPSFDLPTPNVALAIGAHPDDVEFGCGATLAKWAADGCTVHHLICTDGSKGTWDPTADKVALAERRQDEQREAARRLAHDHAGECRFLGYVDGELDSDLAARGRVARVIRELRPDVVLGHDPWKRYRLHPDHRHAGLLACEGVVAARDPHFYPEHDIDHHRPDTLLLFEADEPDHVEDVTGWVASKLAALEAHESQFESTMHALDDIQLDAFRNRIIERLRGLGEAHGFAAAELFKRISDL